MTESLYLMYLIEITSMLTVTVANISVTLRSKVQKPGKKIKQDHKCTPCFTMVATEAWKEIYEC